MLPLEKSVISFQRANTAEGVKESSVLKMAPLVCSQRTLPTQPAPVSKIWPLSGHLFKRHPPSQPTRWWWWWRPSLQRTRAALLMGQPSYHRGHQFWFEMVEDLFGKDGGGHGRGGDGSDGVGFDVVLDAFARERLGEADKAHFGCTVVGLAKVAVESL